MFVFLIIFVWLAWLGVRAWLRRSDPEGFALLTGEAPEAPVTRAPVSAQVRPQGAPPAVGALVPRNAATYGQIPAYDRRRASRRRLAAAIPASADRRLTYDRRSA
jgi:hypothetical protein